MNPKLGMEEAGESPYEAKDSEMQGLEMHYGM